MTLNCVFNQHNELALIPISKLTVGELGDNRIEAHFNSTRTPSVIGAWSKRFHKFFLFISFSEWFIFNNEKKKTLTRYSIECTEMELIFNNILFMAIISTFFWSPCLITLKWEPEYQFDLKNGRITITNANCRRIYVHFIAIINDSTRKREKIHDDSRFK